MMRRVYVVVLCVFPLLILASCTPQSKSAGYTKKDLDKAVQSGIAYLADSQDPRSGGWAHINNNYPVASVAQAILALMANDQLPGRGKYEGNLKKAVWFLLNRFRADGLVDSNNSGNYEQAFAVHCLARVYGAIEDEWLKSKIQVVLQKAVDRSVAMQRGMGGWSEGDFDCQTPLTACFVMALCEARNSGMNVPPDTLKKALRYIKGCANSDGGFGYSKPDEKSLFPRSAAAVCALQMLDEASAKETVRGLEYLEREAKNTPAFYMYANYFAARAFYQKGGKPWKTWCAKKWPELIGKQMKNGSWMDTDSGGEVYSSGMALLILQMDKHLQDGAKHGK